MGTGIILHGYIDCPGRGYIPEVKRVFRFNRRVLSQLPETATEWPPLTRGMFSMLPLRTSRERYIPQYENQIIHFAGDYKDMWILEAEWIVKFERLLSRLCWYRAVVELGSYRYEWSVLWDDGIGTRYRNNPPLPPEKWLFQCYKLDRQPVASAEAVKGTISSPHHVELS